MRVCVSQRKIIRKIDENVSCVQDDFIALEMVDRRIRFAWDVGGGPGAVTSPVTLRAPREPGRDEVWYRVEAERTGNVGHLLVVEAVRPDGAPPPKVVFNATSAGFGRLDLGDSSGAGLVWVGGVPGSGPGSALGPGVLMASGSPLAGCLHSLKLDGRPIGLWNFKTSSKDCGACKQGWVGTPANQRRAPGCLCGTCRRCAHSRPKC